MADYNVHTTWHSQWSGIAHATVSRTVIGTVSLNYSGLTLSASFNGRQESSYSSNPYGVVDTIRFYVDGTQFGEAHMNILGTHSFSFSGNANVSVGNHTVTLTAYCSDILNSSVGGCGAGLTGPVNIGSWGIYVPDPYSPPSYDIWSATQIVKVDRDKVDVNYKIDGGTNGLDWVIARVDGVKDFGFGTGKGNSLWGSFYPKWSEGFRHGSSYNVRIRFSDNHSEYQTGHKTFYTYQEPTLSGVSANPTTVNAQNQDITFTQSGINDRAWTTLEQKFYTLAHCSYNGTNIGNGWTQVGTAGNNASFILNGATLRGFVPKAYDNQTVTMHVKRRNNSANWESAEKTCTFLVHYRPVKGVTCGNLSYRKNNSSGGGIGKDDLVINDNSLSGIYLSWVYDTTTADAGYTQGYRIRLYNQAGTVVKTYYTTSKSYTIPKADIPRMQHTQVDVTPYFGNDQAQLSSSSYANNYWYYTSPTKCDFVVMAAKLAKPSITYPVEGSDWINTKFRVCFQLPTDPDKGYELETYHYDDIEIEVNGKVFRLTANPAGKTTSGIQAAAISSALASNLTYQRKMIFAPFKASGFPIATTYKLRVRVKKKYTGDKNNWSDWSNVRTFTVTPAVFTPARGDIIYATHYNNSKATINRVRNTYGVVWNNQPANVSRGTIIYRSQYPYASWYDRIVATKKQVNNYGSFDNIDVRFDHTNDILENFTQYIELVTAASNEAKSDASGRNYMKIVYDRCNRLI